MSNLNGYSIACIDCEHCKKDGDIYHCNIGVVLPYIGNPFIECYCPFERVEWPEGTRPIELQ